MLTLIGICCFVSIVERTVFIAGRVIQHLRSIRVLP